MLFEQLASKSFFTKEDLVRMLRANENEGQLLFAHSAKVREDQLGLNVYLRGLVEISNSCKKNCLYCGIRKDNAETTRYQLSDDEILGAASFAYKNSFGSIVLQGGELSSSAHVSRIAQLVKQIKKLSNGELGITLSLGEQDEKTYQQWFEAGAHRYLLRIESSSEALYAKIHPNDKLHSYAARLRSLELLKKVGYQVGTGVMIGLPFQTVEDLADDLLFFQAIDVDMVGMGPYIEHKHTPLYAYKNSLLPLEERYFLALKMVACLRILMGNINIAAVTSLQAIRPEGREDAIKVGANVIMPNITPGVWRNVYKLYENKPTVGQSDEDNLALLASRIESIGFKLSLGQWGDSKHFSERGRG